MQNPPQANDIEIKPLSYFFRWFVAVFLLMLGGYMAFIYVIFTWEFVLTDCVEDSVAYTPEFVTFPESTLARTEEVTMWAYTGRNYYFETTSTQADIVNYYDMIDGMNCSGAIGAGHVWCNSGELSPHGTYDVVISATTTDGTAYRVDATWEECRVRRLSP